MNDDISLALTGEVLSLQGQLASVLKAESFPSLIDPYRSLSGLRGFWPMSSAANTAQVYDAGDQARHIRAVGGTPLMDSEGLVPFMSFAGGEAYYRNDENGLDILGTETYIAAARRGFTLLAWARFDGAAAATEYVLSKRDGTANNANYGLYRDSLGHLSVIVGSGAANEIQASTGTLSADVWYFVAGRWEPSADLCVWVNNVKECAGSSAIAAANNNAFEFQIGGRDNGAGGTAFNLTGDIAQVALVASALTDEVISNLFNRTRSAFKV